MRRYGLIDLDVVRRFCDAVNTGLHDGGDVSAATHARLAREFPDAMWLLDDLLATFRIAQSPQHTVMLRLDTQDYRFRQAYQLLQDVFDPDSIAYERLPVADITADDGPSPVVTFARYALVPGSHSYDPDGQLVHFHYDPLATTEVLVGTIDGNSLVLPGRKLHGGALSYLAIRPAFRGGRGHGSALVRAFEAAMHDAATSAGQPLALMILEAEERARAYWFKQGYRWPQGSVYVAPPQRFDPQTGAPLSATVPETLMLKMTDPARPGDRIDRTLLLDTVRELLTSWYMPDNLATTAARQRVESVIFGEILAAFAASLPPGDDPVPLVEPPAPPK